MLMLSFVLGLGLLTYYFSGVLERRENPNQFLSSETASDGSITVNLLRNPQGHYVLDGQINGRTIRFLLDTGATDVVVPARLAQETGLVPEFATRASTANGIITVHSTNIATLNIGAITLNNIPASINPEMHTDTVLLGMSALRRLEFTQRGNQLTLRQLPQSTGF